MHKHIGEYGLDVTTGKVSAIKEAQGGYVLSCDNKEIFVKSVILACGASPKRLGAKGEDKFIGRGISYCATCDGPLFKNKEVAVIGGGDRAFEEAEFLTRYAAKVSIIHRRNAFRASEVLQERVRKNPKIELILEHTVEEVEGAARLEKIKLKNVKTNEIISRKFDGLFIFVGIAPNTQFLSGFVKTDGDGFIECVEDLVTSKKGIFVAGDCRKKKLYQVITAASDGAIAAQAAHQYILGA